MIYSGQSAIDYLAEQIQETDDSAASSHWRKYHSEFVYTGEGFNGLQGFGGLSKSNFFRRFFHRIFQRKFRRLGFKLTSFSEIDTKANEISQSQGRVYDLDFLRQSLTVAFLKSHLKLTQPETACVIGDGFASMTSLLLANKLSNQIILVNLTKTLLVDLWYLKLWMGPDAFDSTVTLVTELKSLEEVLAQPIGNLDSQRRVIAIQAVDHQLIRHCPIDLAINSVSMQEMNPTIIKEYFDDLHEISSKRELFFYCCNREEKILPDGTITRFSHYPWNVKDFIIVDELCPWHQEFYTFLPPFYRPYDGPIRHRLTNICPSK